MAAELVTDALAFKAERGMATELPSSIDQNDAAETLVLGPVD